MYFSREQGYVRRRKEYGGLEVGQTRMKVLEENVRLRRGVSDLALDELILEEVAWENL